MEAKSQRTFSLMIMIVALFQGLHTQTVAPNGFFKPFNPADPYEVLFIGQYNKYYALSAGYIASASSILKQIGQTVPSLDQTNSLQVLILLLDSVQTNLNATRLNRRHNYSFSPLSTVNLWWAEYDTSSAITHCEYAILAVLTLQSAFIGLTLIQAIVYIKQQTQAGIVAASYMENAGMPLGLGVGPANNQAVLNLNLNANLMQVVAVIALALLFA